MRSLITSPRRIRFPNLPTACLGFAMALSTFLLTSCGSSFHTQGLRHLEEQNYDQAVSALVAALKEDSSNAELWRDFGVALARQNDPRAIVALKRAHSLDPDDGATIYALGSYYEDHEDYDKALDYYKRFIEFGFLSGSAGELEDRLEWLIYKAFEEEARIAVANEQALIVAALPDSTIAVLNFKNLGSNSDLDPLQKGLADMVITDLSKVKALRVVERARLQRLVEEIGFGTSGLVDETSAPRVGRLVGARTIVKGSFLDLDESTLRLDAGTANTAAGSFLPTDEVTGDLEEFFRMEKQLVLGIVDDLGIRLSSEERKEIMEIPTESMLAFLAYSKGLDAEDRGQFSEAYSNYQQATRIDPAFSTAQQQMGRVDRVSRGMRMRPRLEMYFRVMRKRYATVRRLQAIGLRVYAGYVSALQARKALQELNAEGAFGNVKVRVEIPIPPP
jgi:tetratricopeptide (TPR) repeat protein